MFLSFRHEVPVMSFPAAMKDRFTHTFHIFVFFLCNTMRAWIANANPANVFAVAAFAGVKFLCAVRSGWTQPSNGVSVRSPSRLDSTLEWDFCVLFCPPGLNLPMGFLAVLSSWTQTRISFLRVCSRFLVNFAAFFCRPPARIGFPVP